MVSLPRKKKLPQRRKEAQAAKKNSLLLALFASKRYLCGLFLGVTACPVRQPMSSPAQ